MHTAKRRVVDHALGTANQRRQAREASHRGGRLVPRLHHRFQIYDDPRLLLLQPRGHQDEFASPGGLAGPLTRGTSTRAEGARAEGGVAGNLGEDPLAEPPRPRSSEVYRCQGGRPGRLNLTSARSTITRRAGVASPTTRGTCMVERTGERQHERESQGEGKSVSERARELKSRGRLSHVVPKRFWYLPIAMFVALSALAAPPQAYAKNRGGPVGAVYMATNQSSGNEIVTFLRFANGSLVPAGSVSTGGLGSGPGAFLAADPLASKDSLVVDEQDRLLFAVNAGSDDVSVFRIDPTGLTFGSVPQSSDGVFPVGLAYDDHTLYVLNAGSNSVAGFQVHSDGTLTHLQTCLLPALPAGADPTVTTETASQVGFSPDGSKLLVVSKEGLLPQNFPTVLATLGSGRVHVYDVNDDGTLANCGAPTTTVLPSNAGGGGKFPFAFTWGSNGQLLLTEVFGAATSLAGSAVSSFTLGADGSLTPISTSVANRQGATCWIVRSGNYVYVTNFVPDSISGYNTISSYKVKTNGRLTLVSSAAASFGSGGESPIDAVVTSDGRFIYQLTPGSALVRSFKVNSTSGALTALTPVPDSQAPNSGQAGIATVDFAATS